jgi:hypothetical protein
MQIPFADVRAVAQGIGLDSRIAPTFAVSEPAAIPNAKDYSNKK